MPAIYAAKKYYQHLYLQVLTAIVIGILLGHFYPEAGIAMKPFGDGFIKLIKMIIAPIIFCTVVTGIACMQELDKVGRVGIKALLYFEVVSTLALVIGLVVVHVIQPGAGMNIDASSLDAKDLATYTAVAKTQSAVDFVLNIIPVSVIDAFAKGDILQVLLFSVLFGFSLAAMKETGAEVVVFIGKISHVLFGIVETIMKLAPLGAFGAMAFTIG
ncbi:MAG: cation:dicarboxylate symporter family transporter, partial [Methylobacter sp.]